MCSLAELCTRSALIDGQGGGFWSGGSSDPRYNLSFIVQDSVKIGKPFIGVSFNYRLSAWCVHLFHINLQYRC